MRKLVFVRRLLLLGALGLSSLILPRPVEGCEICKYWFFLGYAPCRPATGSEVGATGCENYYDPIEGFSCEESGSYCTTVTVSGGSGGGSGGSGGSDPCMTSGFCPAECFSCAGGGGRPAV